MTTGYSHMCMERMEKLHFQVRHDYSKTLQLYKLISQWMRATHMYMLSVKVEVFV